MSDQCKTPAQGQAGLLSLSSNDFIRNAVVETAREYIGVPWRHMGRNKQGVDCVGLIVLIGRECGVHDYKDTTNYVRESKGADLLKPMQLYSKQINPKDMMDGDIAVFRENVFPQHMGIVASLGGQRTLIHAYARERKVVEDDWNAEWQGKLMCAFRFNFLAQE